MKLLTKEILASVPKLFAQDGKGDAAIAYAKFFDPSGSWTWYMTEYDPINDEAFGLVQGFEEELGYFSIRELEKVRNRFGIGIERDINWTPRPIKQCRKGA